MIGKRVVLRCKNNLTFAGLFKKIHEDKIMYLHIETDQSSGFSILCPEDFVDEIIEVPIY